MPNKETTVLPALQRNPAAEAAICQTLINLGPLALHTSLKQVHDMALYHAPELSTDDIAALWYIEQLRLATLHFAEAVVDTAD